MVTKINKDFDKLKKQKQKINSDPRLDAMERTEANAKVSFSFLRRVTQTKKLSSLEDEIANNPDFEFKEVVAMYIYFNKNDKVTKAFYPNLYKVMNEFEKAVENAIDNDPYFEVFKLYEINRNKEKSTKFLIEARKHINKILEDENISIKQLSDFTGIKYANLYNFLVKGMNNKLKITNVHKALWMLWGLKEGLTIEESLDLHLKKVKSLWKEWHLNIDKMSIDIN